MQTLSEVIKQYKLPLLIALISKITILFFIVKLFAYIVPEPRIKDLNVWESWNVWDARHYVAIATSNYHRASNNEAVLIGFLPFFPLMIYLFKSVFNTSVLVAGYVVSAISTILLCIMLYKLVLLDYPKQVAVLTVFMLFIFPTSFFLHIPYTESLFILLSVSAFYFARKGYFWISFLCIGLATFTKIAGIALIPSIFIEFFFEKKNAKGFDFYHTVRIIIPGLLISISGLLVFLYINYYVWGNPLYFTIVQKQFISESFSPFGQGLFSAFQAIVNRVGTEKIMLGYAQVIAFAVGLAASVYTLFKIRLSYGIFMIIILWLSYSLSFWLSMPRHILSLFPIFIVLALLAKNVIFKFVWILTSISLLIFFALIFIQWGPVM